MKNPKKLSTLQIGQLGVFLVQFGLLKNGIDSSHLTTDSGIDLVAYSLGKKRALTIQVKANLKPKPGGGRGRPALDWWVPDDSPAELFAFVDVSESRVWIFSKDELPRFAQQHPEGRYHFYMYVGSVDGRRGEKGLVSHVSRFEEFLLEERLSNFFDSKFPENPQNFSGHHPRIG